MKWAIGAALAIVAVCVISTIGNMQPPKTLTQQITEACAQDTVDPEACKLREMYRVADAYQQRRQRDEDSRVTLP